MWALFAMQLAEVYEGLIIPEPWRSIFRALALLALGCLMCAYGMRARKGSLPLWLGVGLAVGLLAGTTVAITIIGMTIWIGVGFTIGLGFGIIAAVMGDRTKSQKGGR
jgi:hypothetical protein